jgi:tetratricopeptide (TPR) repeat protein
VLIALVATVAVAHAQPAGGGPAAGDGVDAYRAAVEQGTAAFKIGMYADARAAFERAYAIHPDHVLLFNIASCWRRAGDAPSAIAAYRRFLAAAPPDDTRVTLAEQTIGALEEELARGATDDDVEVEVSTGEDGEELDDADLATIGPRTLAPIETPLPAPVPVTAPPPRRSMLPRLGLGTTAAGALVLAAAAFDAYRARTIADELSALPNDHGWNHDDAASYQRGAGAATRARWLAISGAALTATGITVYVIGKHRDASTPTIEGVVAPGGGQVVLRGRF